MNAKTIVGWAVIAFVVWWVIESPDAAAHLVHNIGTFLSTSASGLSNFVSGINGGKNDKGGMPWWEALLIGVGGFAAGVAILWTGIKLLNRRGRENSS